MTNIQAAFLYDQLNDIDHILDLKKKIFQNYNNLFKDNKNIQLQKIENGTERANWIYAIRIIGNNGFKSNLFETRPFFYPINYHKHLEDIKYIYDNNSELLSKEVIMLPSFPELKYEEQIVIYNEIKLYICNLHP